MSVHKSPPALGGMLNDIANLKKYPSLWYLMCDLCDYTAPAEEDQPIFIYFIRKGWFISNGSGSDRCPECNTPEHLHRTMQANPTLLAHPLMAEYYYRYLLKKEK